MTNKYCHSVTAVQEIKQAIETLSFRERCELMAILIPPVYDEWDEQMVKDAEAGGKLDRLRESANQDYQTEMTDTHIETDALETIR